MSKKTTSMFGGTRADHEKQGHAQALRKQTGGKGWGKGRGNPYHVKAGVHEGGQFTSGPSGGGGGLSREQFKTAVDQVGQMKNLSSSDRQRAIEALGKSVDAETAAAAARKGAGLGATIGDKTPATEALAKAIASKGAKFKQGGLADQVGFIMPDLRVKVNGQTMQFKSLEEIMRRFGLRLSDITPYK